MKRLVCRIRGHRWGVWWGGLYTVSSYTSWSASGETAESHDRVAGESRFCFRCGQWEYRFDG